MSINSSSLTTTLLSKLYLAEQLDALHMSLVTILEMAEDGEFELILEKSGKSLKQKALYIQKVLEQVTSPELKDALKEVVDQGDLDFFSKKECLDFFRNLQNQAEQIQVVKLSVAIKFKDSDLREMVEEFSKKIEAPVAFAVKVEKGLIGGAIIQYGNYINDYSLKSRLDQFRTKWKTATLQ